MVMNFCQLFSLSGFSVQQVSLGILHVMGLGVSTYVLGNVFFEASDNTGLARTKKNGRCALLWQKLQAYCTVNRIKYQLQNLTLSMLKPGGKPPTVRGKGMQFTCIVDLWLQLAGEIHKARQFTHTHIVHLLVHIYIYCSSSTNAC